MGNKKSNLQFTPLTPTDVVIHEDLYISLLVDDRGKTLEEKVLELPMAKARFSKTFE